MEKLQDMDQIPAELIKEGGTELKKVIYELILKIWAEEIILHEWKYGIICPNHEKGDTMICENYRAFTLLCTTYKILANILYSKLVPYTEEITGEYQGGFQRGRSTVDKIFMMRKTMEKCWEQNIDVYYLFIDFQSAHDTV
jgi:hypothetical protein